MLNVSKLVRWNLSQPYEKRKAYLELVETLEFAKSPSNRGALAALHCQINIEITAAEAAHQKEIEDLDHWALNG